MASLSHQLQQSPGRQCSPHDLEHKGRVQQEVGHCLQHLAAGESCPHELLHQPRRPLQGTEWGHAVRLRPQQLPPMHRLKQGQPSPPASTQAKHMHGCRRFQPLVQWEVRPNLQAHCHGSSTSILEHRSSSCPGFTLLSDLSQ